MTAPTSTRERGARADPAADTSRWVAWYDRQRSWVLVTLWAGLAVLTVLTPWLYWTLTGGHPMFLHGYL